MFLLYATACTLVCPFGSCSNMARGRGVKYITQTMYFLHTFHTTISMCQASVTPQTDAQHKQAGFTMSQVAAAMCNAFEHGSVSRALADNLSKLLGPGLTSARYSARNSHVNAFFSDLHIVSRPLQYPVASVRAISRVQMQFSSSTQGFSAHSLAKQAHALSMGKCCTSVSTPCNKVCVCGHQHHLRVSNISTHHIHTQSIIARCALHGSSIVRPLPPLHHQCAAALAHTLAAVGSTPRR